MVRKHTAKFAVLLAMTVMAAALTGCEVFGYNTPVVGYTAGSWHTVELTDPLTGDKLISLRTKTRPNTFFGKFMSLFGRPTFTVSCIQGGPDDNKIRATIDWREAVGPPNVRRKVQSRFDGGKVREHTWVTTANGRQSNLFVTESGYVTRLKKANTLAVRTSNSGGNPVTLVFNIAGFDTVYAGLPDTCG